MLLSSSSVTLLELSELNTVLPILCAAETTIDDLLEVLDSMGTPGSSCAGGSAAMLPANPGLEVEGVGFLALPLSDREVSGHPKSFRRRAEPGRTGGLC